MPGCTDDVQRICEPEPLTLPCSLGCNAAGTECRGLVPSNGATREHLEGVNRRLVIPTSPDIQQELASIDTDTGRIDVYGNVVRGGGEGVVDGIGFYRLNDELSVLAVTELEVAPDGFVFAFGDRALIVLSAGDVFIEGVVDVSAACDVEGGVRCGGPGGGDGARTGTLNNATGCAPGGNGSGVAGLGGEETGGGGGGLGEDGADAGESGDRVVEPGQGGEVPDEGGGGTCPGPDLVPLRGGSGGGSGGLPGFGGIGGGGGGALQITSFTRIELNGFGSGQFIPAITAAGGGGGGGIDSGGGGGGGSGGGILLEAPEIAMRFAVLAANGGGGGGGGGGPQAGDTTAGQSGRLSDEPAEGGTGRRAGGRGGSERDNARDGEGGGDDTGGGGGGAGIIRLNVPADGLIIDGDSVVSPAHTRGEIVME